MEDFPKNLRNKLARRADRYAFRHLSETDGLIDFSSNDYLGLSGNREIFDRASRRLSDGKMVRNGATGSRLLSGNHPLYSELEKRLAEFHKTDAALVFNSGYDANIGFFGCVPQRGDVVFYDEHIHASIRDGIRMGNAKSYKFGHNDLENLKIKLRRTGLVDTGHPGPDGGRVVGGSRRFHGEIGGAEKRSVGEAEVYVVTESVFSMDGDSPDLKAFTSFCREYGYRFVVDEAHAVGVFGANGKGLVQYLGLQDAVFARIVTFGKAMGCHGAAILGSNRLKEYLVNFARSLMYTTGLPPHAVATILSAYDQLSSDDTPQAQLQGNILFFKRKLVELDLKKHFIPSDSAIHCCIVPGNERVRAVSESIRKNGFDVKAILSPTVPEGRERLRICIHNFNTGEEMQTLLELLSKENSAPTPS
ncbi:MAG TPA: 8-amino-7-oxononanoate synthase [Pricia sp.]|nr:8-amino-7-oxononanoate synthase [Pricia sp.]